MIEILGSKGETVWVVAKPLKCSIMTFAMPFYFSNFTCEMEKIGLDNL